MSIHSSYHARMDRDHLSRKNVHLGMSGVEFNDYAFVVDMFDILMGAE